MTNSLMKLLAIPALLLTGAGAVKILTDYPYNSTFEVGSEFVLEWEKEIGDDGDAFKLTMNTFLVAPIIVEPGPSYDFNGSDIVLDDAVGFSDGSYTWVIEPVDGRTGYTYWYRFGLQYSGTYVYPKPFFIDY
ncbi:hypothetical protein F4820DRAFT_451392 [Hypoxylon rubiginosum]|uniref:Uncharacterized protein n=1 Tax=Hypoxylon rubiginosum TaxID=110542 RepID=A0ACB9YRH6_9PEZI|nr:hypothetical protein F4820DRAFT_451392 [Hypoxylon rubiginosum]